MGFGHETPGGKQVSNEASTVYCRVKSEPDRCSYESCRLTREQGRGSGGCGAGHEGLPWWSSRQRTRASAVALVASVCEGWWGGASVCDEDGNDKGSSLERSDVRVDGGTRRQSGLQMCKERMRGLKQGKVKRHGEERAKKGGESQVRPGAVAGGR